MTHKSSTAERLRRANALWHAYLTTTGQRFELAAFLSDPELEKQTVAQALASGDQKLVSLAEEWLRDAGQAVAYVTAARVTLAQAATANLVPAEAAKPSRYLRGVR
jgi:aspartokinase